MKPPPLLTPLLLLCLSLASPAAAAPDSRDAAPPAAAAPEWAELFGDAPLPIVWQSVAAAAERITKALAADTLEGVDDWAETIHLGAHALMDQVRLPEPEQQRRLVAALGQAATLADEVLDGAQHGEAGPAKAAFRRVQSALQLAQRRLPPEITTAPPGEPRFARASAHGDHAH